MMETLQREAITALCDENARLTAALHAAKAHPDYSYIVTPPDRAILSDGGWERNREAKDGSGDECWRRRKDGP